MPLPSNPLTCEKPQFNLCKKVEQVADQRCPKSTLYHYANITRAGPWANRYAITCRMGFVAGTGLGYHYTCYAKNYLYTRNTCVKLVIFNMCQKRRRHFTPKQAVHAKNSAHLGLVMLCYMCLCLSVVCLCVHVGVFVFVSTHNVLLTKSWTEWPTLPQNQL